MKVIEFTSFIKLFDNTDPFLKIISFYSLKNEILQNILKINYVSSVLLIISKNLGRNLPEISFTYFLQQGTFSSFYSEKSL
jgi:hypothetical protein